MRDLLFKGCTRPAMLLGVPIAPMVLVNGVLAILGITVHPGMFVLNVVAILIMRGIVKHDDQQFRLLGLRMMLRPRASRNSHVWRSAAYSPVTFTKRKP